MSTVSWSRDDLIFRAMMDCFSSSLSSVCEWWPIKTPNTNGRSADFCHAYSFLSFLLGSTNLRSLLLICKDTNWSDLSSQEKILHHHPWRTQTFFKCSCKISQRSWRRKSTSDRAELRLLCRAAVCVGIRLVIQHRQIPNISCFVTLKPPPGLSVCLEQCVQIHWRLRPRMS